MVLSVFARHSSNCKFKRDRLYRRCNCPKWVGGQVNKEYFRQSASTRVWEEAERCCQKLEEALEKGLPPFGPTPAVDLDFELGSASSSISASLFPVPRLAPPPLPTPTPSNATEEIKSLFPEVLPPASISSDPPVSKNKPRVTISKAVDAYLSDALSRGLKPDTLSKLERLFRNQLLSWAEAEGLEYLDQLDLDALLSFRSIWHEGALVRSKKQERVVGFFWVCFRRNYISQNPALGLSKIKTVQVPTDYFPREEFARILEATYVYGDPRGGFIDIEATRIRLRTLTLLMRWSGLRIRDAVILERNRLNGDSLMLYQAKTGQPVYVPLPPDVVEALKNIPDGPKPNPRYFFWSGNGLPKSAVADWQRSYRRLFQIADIRQLDGERKRCHPHMFRDTFAVEMLLAGVPIDQVSILLGHSSVRITEKHYAPFVKARQLQLQASVRAAWTVNEPSPGGSENQPLKLAAPQKQAGWKLIVNTQRREDT